MKYFTCGTLTFLTLNCLLFSLSAENAQSDRSETPAIASGSGDSLLKDPSRTVGQIVEAIKSVFTTPKDLIKDRLEVPKPLDTDTIIKISPSEVVCQVRTASEFWKTLFKVSDPGDVEKVVFCPAAVSYLKEIDSAKLLKNATGDNLRVILSALMLRQLTLIGKYTSSYMDSNYLTCFNALWDRVQNTTEGNESWPCTATSCDAPSIKANFSAFVDSTPACKAVLKDQLDVYAVRVAEAATTNKITMATVLREAILENLTSAPHLSIPLYAAYEGVIEINKAAAAAQIKKTLEDVKGTLAKQLNGLDTAYADAEKCFKARMECIEKGSAVESAEPKSVKTVPAANTDPNSIKATDKSADNSTATPPATATDKSTATTNSGSKDPLPESTTTKTASHPPTTTHH